MSIGLVTYSFMTTSGALQQSSAKAFAVVAMVGR